MRKKCQILKVAAKIARQLPSLRYFVRILLWFATVRNQLWELRLVMFAIKYFFYGLFQFQRVQTCRSDDNFQILLMYRDGTCLPSRVTGKMLNANTNEVTPHNLLI